MRLSLLTFLCLFVCNFASAQIGTYGFNGNKKPIAKMGSKAAKAKMEMMSMARTAKTVFICKKTDDIAAMEKAFKEVWTLGEISVVPYDKLGSVDFNNTTVFSFDYHRYSVHESPAFDVFLKFWMEGKDKKGNPQYKTLCRIEMFPESKDFIELIKMKDKKRMEFIYGEAEFKNYNLGFLKTYVKNVNDMLNRGQERDLREFSTNDIELEKLKEATLYFPKYTFLRNGATGKKRASGTSLLKNYPYSSKVISTPELEKLILESAQPIYYVVYVVGNTTKYFSIFNSKTGDLVYSTSKMNSFYIKDGDIKALVKAID